MWCKKFIAFFLTKKRDEAMLCIEPSNLFSISEANRNFSNIAKNVDSKNDTVIIKNNKPVYAVIDIEKYQTIIKQQQEEKEEKEKEETEEEEKEKEEKQIDIENMIPVSKICNLLFTSSSIENPIIIIKNNKPLYMLMSFYNNTSQINQDNCFSITDMRRAQKKVIKCIDENGYAFIKKRNPDKIIYTKEQEKVDYYVIFTIKKYNQYMEYLSKKNKELDEEIKRDFEM